MVVEIPLLGPLTKELCRPPGRALDVTRFSIRADTLIESINELANTCGKLAPLVFIRSLAMRQFHPVPEFARPKRMVPAVVGMPTGWDAPLSPILGGTDFGWSARNRWYFDEAYSIPVNGIRLPFASISANWNGLINDGSADIEAATFTNPRAELAIADKVPDENLTPNQMASQVWGEYPTGRHFAYNGYWTEQAETRVSPKHGVAMDLLRRHLTTEQRLELLTKKHFTVIGSEGGVFRIHENSGGWSVDELEKGKVVAEWCIVPAPAVVAPAGAEMVIENQVFESWPTGDVLLARKLMIETDEPAFRAVANRNLIPHADANRGIMLDLARLALLLIEHATDHEWWNSILRSLKAKSHPAIEVIHV